MQRTAQREIWNGDANRTQERFCNSTLIPPKETAAHTHTAAVRGGRPNERIACVPPAISNAACRAACAPLPSAGNAQAHRRAATVISAMQPPTVSIACALP